ncbi:DMT family transporter [Paenibacillus sacheonensis]|uniref:EamA family transporter n=1 Tax=Paenibacillus sacheonensis TaxID=742054 RepID=A0A7X5C1J2_9BACL|nr:DMT family transporter [Paenibacillus sacheonensis]MBM7567296.1 drug/metabolite transporter (DMT)-like permease [Paenibacillus sacheonensis]NBC72812.1 EamA family transporter [Paenibacillus sacheonensis]
MQPLSRQQTILYLAFLVLVWGANWPLSKYALDFTPPLLFAGLRTLIGGLLLVLVALPHAKRIRWKETWPIYLISSVLNIMLYYGLQTVGLLYLPAGLFSAIVFLQPVLLGVLSWLWLGEKMFPLRVIGLLLGFAGVAVISVSGGMGQFSLPGVLLALGSAVCWAFGTVYMKKMSAKADTTWVVALQITIGGIVLLLSGSVSESWAAIDWQPSFILDLLFIAIFVIGLGWLAYFKLVGSGEAAKVGSYTFLIPLVALLISVLFMNESISIKLLAGLVLIVGSILLVNAKSKSQRASGKAAAVRLKERPHP